MVPEMLTKKVRKYINWPVFFIYTHTNTHLRKVLSLKKGIVIQVSTINLTFNIFDLIYNEKFMRFNGAFRIVVYGFRLRAPKFNFFSNMFNDVLKF